MEYKIGDFVTERFSGKNGRIIADKETPYMHMGVMPLYPNHGFDFLIGVIHYEEGKVEPHVHATTQHLMPWIPPTHIQEEYEQ